MGDDARQPDAPGNEPSSTGRTISQKDRMFLELVSEKLDLDPETAERSAVDIFNIDRFQLSQKLVRSGKLSETQAQELLQEVESQEFAGSRIGRYELLERLGAGGMGEVYKAFRPDLKQVVAVKILSKRLASDDEFVARFEREAQLAAQLDHPNIIKGLDLGFDQGHHYFVMEYVEGESAASLQKRKGSLSEEEVLKIGLQMARALEHAQSLNLVHRDIKPDNIMITSDGTAKLADLGLARQVSSDSLHLTLTGVIMGTPYYMSPEQASGLPDLDVRSDIYSLGATLFHLLAGLPPFASTNVTATLQARLADDPPGVRDFTPSVSKGTEAVIAKMMARRPEDRYQTPSELAEDLQRILDGQSPRYARVGGLMAWLGYGGIKRERRRRIVRAVARSFAALVVLGGGALGVWAYMREPDPEATRQKVMEAEKEASRKARRQQFERLVRAGVAQAEKGRLREALAKLEEAHRLFPSDKLAAKIAQIKRSIARRDLEKKVLREATELLQADDFKRALAVLEASGLSTPDVKNLEDDLRNLCSQAEALEAAARMEREKEWKKALDLYSSVVSSPNARLRSKAVEGQARVRRVMRHFSLFEKARAAERDGHLEEARRLALEAAKLPPENDAELDGFISSVNEAIARAERARSEEEARKKALRLERSGLVEEAEGKAAEGAFSQALALLDRAAKIAPGKDIEEASRRYSFRLRLKRVEEALRVGDIDSARSYLAAAVPLARSEREKQLLASFREDAAAYDKAVSLHSAGRFDEALRVANALASAETLWKTAALELVKAVEREKEFSALAEKARRAAGDFDWEGALRAAEAALAIRPASRELQAIRDKARNRLQLPGTFVNSLGMEMVLVRGGRFIMGGGPPRPADETPAHEVFVDDFYVSRTPVTNGMYRELTGKDPSVRPVSPGEDYPVVFVSWVEAAAFCQALSKKEGRQYRLPSEAEWEYAARGNDDRVFPWGNEPPGSGKVWRMNYNCDGRSRRRWRADGFEFCSPVGSYPEGASPWGLLDMAGNVWEWCSDWYAPDYYSGSPSHNPPGPPGGNKKVVRGGCWMLGKDAARCRNRNAFEPKLKDGTIGFRVVAEIADRQGDGGR